VNGVQLPGGVVFASGQAMAASMREAGDTGATWQRLVADTFGLDAADDEVIARAPDIIIASWCGKKFRAEKVKTRPGFETVPAVRNDRLHEIKSALILQPGPAALTDGLAALEAIMAGWG